MPPFRVAETDSRVSSLDLAWFFTGCTDDSEPFAGLNHWLRSGRALGSRDAWPSFSPGAPLCAPLLLCGHCSSPGVWLAERGCSWISTSVSLPLNWEPALLFMVARGWGRSRYSFRVMGSCACGGVSLSCIACYPGGVCYSC